MQIPALTDQRDHRSLGSQQSLDVGVVLRLGAFFQGGAKSGDFRFLELHLAGALEESLIFGVRAGPAALDVMHAELVQPLGNLQLVIDGIRDALALGAVTQGRVI